MIHIVLFEPEIPPNTGNVIRLCANMGAQLHLVKPLAFDFDDKKLRRAGLDYHEWASVKLHDNFQSLLRDLSSISMYALSTKGKVSYTEINYESDIALVYGPETRGLPNEVLEQIGTSHILRIPMRAGSRSLNLSNSVAIVAYHVWMAQGFI